MKTDDWEEEEFLKKVKERIRAAEQRIIDNLSKDLFSDNFISSYPCDYTPKPWYKRIYNKIRAKYWGAREWLSKKIYPWDEEYRGDDW